MRHWPYLVLIALLAGSVAQAAPNEPPLLPPPMAQPQDLSIFRGHSIEVPLRAQGRTPGQLRFLIRSRPSKGRLGEIRITGPKSGVVTYTHEGPDDGADSFTFAVQAMDSPVSAAAPISIAILEEPPALSVVHSVDFGSVLLGETSEQQVVLRNSGGGMLTGRMDVSPPWAILGSSEYRLGRNQEQKVRLIYAPEMEQLYSGSLTFSRNPRSAVELSGSAISPFEFDPAREIELTSQNGSSRRSGALVVRNRTARDRIVDVSVPPEIASPDQVTVPAGGETRIALHTQTDFLGALEGVVALESGGFRRGIPVRVFALQPVLRIEPREGLDFGDIEPRTRHTAHLRIRNDGGTAARLKATAPNEILLLPDPNTAVLPPGETRIFQAVLEVSSAGDYRSRIVIEAGTAKPISVDVAANGVEQAAEARKVPILTISPSLSEPESTPSESLSPIPPVTDIKVLKASNRVFEIGWNKPSPEPATWVIQQQQFEMPNEDSPKLVWRDLRNIRFSEQNGMVVARFENLAPGQVWLMRIVSIDKEGRRSAPSPTLKLLSAQPKRFSAARWIVGILVAGAIAFAFAKLRRRRQAEAFREADRIARIEGR
ncbi:MAG TPA: hypothetical protein VFO90_08390 [Terrimicrobiaceae bacterium]|nr:hypothetical protein [Terrimicrobiaceae bacterium]